MPDKKLDEAIKKQTTEREPLWLGPESDEQYGGVTQSLLNSFLFCRERFRINYLLGLQTDRGFNHRLEFGSMWHTCEEHSEGDWLKSLKDYCNKLSEKYPISRSDIIKWFTICKLQFPVYLEYWKEQNKKTKQRKRETLLSEEVFNIPYELPSSGRIVYLKGKTDKVEKIDKGLCVTDHKTKGDINEEQIANQLAFDLQTMFYVVAIDSEASREQYKLGKTPINEVCYNVIRRPLSGGRGSIKQKKTETLSEFYDRLVTDYIKAEPEYYFMRWDVRVLQRDIERFKIEFLNPILEQLCEWYTVMTEGNPGESDFVHYRTPFGIWNPLAKTGRSELDDYLETGNQVGLKRVDTLFEELYEVE